MSKRQPQHDSPNPSEPTPAQVAAVLDDVERDGVTALEPTTTPQDSPSEPQGDDQPQSEPVTADSPSEPQGDDQAQDSPSEPVTADVDPADAAWLALLDAWTDSDDATGTVPLAQGEHATSTMLALGRVGTKRADGVRDGLLDRLDQHAASTAKANRDLGALDRADAVRAFVVGRLALVGAQGAQIVVDPIQHAANVLATLDAIRALTLGALDDDAQAAAHALVASGSATADVAILGTPRKRSTSPTPRTGSTSPSGPRATAGTIPSEIIAYLTANAAQGQRVKLGDIAAAIGRSQGAVRAALDRGTVAGVVLVAQDADGPYGARLAQVAPASAPVA